MATCWPPATRTARCGCGTRLPAAHRQLFGCSHRLWRRVTAMAFSPDGKLLATADGDGTVRLWNPRTGQPIGVPPPAVTDWRRVTGVAFSPDGMLLATASGDGTVRLWNPRTGQPVGAPLPPAATVSGGGVTGIAFSPDGNCSPPPTSTAAFQYGRYGCT